MRAPACKLLGRLPDRLAREEAGAAALEAAAALPLLAALAFGVAEFGNLFYGQQLIQAGLRDAARYLSRVDDPAASEADARRLASTGRIVAGGQKRVAWWAPETISFAYASIANPTDPDTGTRAYRGAASVTVIRVSAVVPYQGIGFLDMLRLAPLQVSLAHEERHVGE